MRILADTNILISALQYPESKPAIALLHAARHHNLVLSDYNINELRRVVSAKFSQLYPDIDRFLAELSFELIMAPASFETRMEDPNDSPILGAAISSDVDVIISGDKHFLRLDLCRPQTITAAQYLETVKKNQ